MAVEVFLNFNGNCRDAVKFYAQVFRLEEPKIMTYGDAPPDSQMPVTKDTKNLVMYTSLNIHGSNVMFMGTLPDMPIIQGNNITLTIGSKDLVEVRRLFHEMKEGGNVIMDLQETFWSKCYGMFIDKFGIPWQVMLNIS